MRNLASHPTLAVPVAVVPQIKPRKFGQPQKVREDRIRRRAGAAWARLAASGQQIARTLRLSPSAVTHRKEGLGSFASALLEVDALERSGVDTASMLEVWLSVTMDARAAFQGGRKLEVRSLGHEVTRADADEDCERVAYYDRQPGAASRWCAAIDRYLARVLPLRHALVAEVER